MLAFILLIVLPAALIALSFRIRPLVPADEGPRDVLGVNLASGGLFGSHGLAADPRSVREDTEPVRFDLSGLPARPDPRERE
ncbi:MULTISPECIES: hypothetical protein [unclassified Deinococcus]|uniref:hypothetical protein n=1 Tax=unclassified Deinococcus TaxID=2623546 RepID=UPI000C1A2D53|nr:MULTISPECIES: hypothetical protein [unclassified Deinococcus]MCD0160764.1 hypothetical protein [Deinococcus sp. 6YEL10]PIH00317.1 hypothetical protein AMD26_001740 [Deinococcus sp. UR1]